MPGLFQGLEIGKRALMTHQMTLQTTGHNIANVDTPGYTRQRVRISATSPEASPKGSIGTGVQVDDINQIRDYFLGEQYRQAQKSLGQWQYKEKSLNQLEGLFNEPNDTAINDLLNQFWASWSDLSTNSDSTNNRTMIIAQAQQLIHGFNQLATSLTELRNATDRDVQNLIADVNSKTNEIARLNRQIATAEVDGSKANDLRDARDLLTDELASIIDVRTMEKPNGSTVVSMGAMSLVDGAESFAIDATVKNVNGQTTSSIVWKGTTVKLRNLSGELAGLTETRDMVIPGYLDKLNNLARGIVERVNTLHMSGFDLNGNSGVAFFDPQYTDAANIRINQDILVDTNRIVASSVATGDNVIALAIADLRNQSTMENSSSTFNNYYNSLVGGLGVESDEAKSFSANYELLVQQIDNSRQSVQGVSLDEEMTNLIKSQHAYDAAARLITTMDEALQTVITGMGVVGR